MSKVTHERASEAERVIRAITEWSRAAGLTSALVGSWARGAPNMGSDVDVIVLTDEPRRLIEAESWWDFLGPAELVRTQRWGVVTERRLLLPSGLEVEFGIAESSWAAVDPVDAGTHAVVNGGFVILSDPARLLEALLREAEPPGGRG